jgi:hypothetical protein
MKSKFIGAVLVAVVTSLYMTSFATAQIVQYTVCTPSYPLFGSWSDHCVVQNSPPWQPSLAPPIGGGSGYNCNLNGTNAGTCWPSNWTGSGYASPGPPPPAPHAHEGEPTLHTPVNPNPSTLEGLHTPPPPCPNPTNPGPC